MRDMGGVTVYLHSFLTSVPHGVDMLLCVSDNVNSESALKTGRPTLQHTTSFPKLSAHSSYNISSGIQLIKCHKMTKHEWIHSAVPNDVLPNYSQQQV